VLLDTSIEQLVTRLLQIRNAAFIGVNGSTFCSTLFHKKSVKCFLHTCLYPPPPAGSITNYDISYYKDLLPAEDQELLVRGKKKEEK
jgi:hypothetical protein